MHSIQRAEANGQFERKALPQAAFDERRLIGLYCQSSSPDRPSTPGHAD
jgi:hypothetical protein